MTITKSTSAPLVVIGGATGNQGGSVLHYLRESDKEYRLRALTRDNTKPKAKALSELGVEVVSIDLKPENKEKIQEVYSGADVVFVSPLLSIMVFFANGARNSPLPTSGNTSTWKG